jgi:hypothetical protein
MSEKNNSPMAITNSLQNFKERRDALLHEDADGFHHFAERFIAFSSSDPLIRRVLDPLKDKFKNLDVDQWWAQGRGTYRMPDLPTDEDQDLIFRYQVLESVAGDMKRMREFGDLINKSKIAEITESFRSIILRPMMSELKRRLSEAANLATPEALEVQAVPLVRIPTAKETKIFLSHKNENKALVRTYYDALKLVGFDPWMDESDMVAGSNLHRELLQGFEESCAVVFFITEHFKDERYLATEIDYAIQEKLRKEKKFSIITLTYPGAQPVPRILQSYIHRAIDNDLDGFQEIVKGLPIELGPIRWKREVVS